MPKRSELWVGLTVIAALCVFFYGTFRISSCTALAPEGQRLVASFDNASGVELRTAVTIAGVRVGEVEAVDLEQGRARVRLRVEESGVELPIDSRVAIRSRGLLGERIIEITPGQSDQLLPEGGILTDTVDAPNVDRLLDRLADVADDIKEVSHSLRLVLGGPEGEAALAEIVQNVRLVTRDVRDFVDENEVRLVGILENFEAFSGDLARITEDNGQTVEELLTNFRDTSEQLQVAVGDLSKASRRVAEGKGTLGKLVQDEALYEEAQASLQELQATLREVRQAAEDAQEQLPVTVLGTVVGTLF